jgi:hypothetical protein
MKMFNEAQSTLTLSAVSSQVAKTAVFVCIFAQNPDSELLYSQGKIAEACLYQGLNLSSFFFRRVTVSDVEMVHTNR